MDMKATLLLCATVQGLLGCGRPEPGSDNLCINYLSGPCFRNDTQALRSDLKVIGFPYDRLDRSRLGPSGGYFGVLHVGESFVMTLEGRGFRDVVGLEWRSRDSQIVRVEAATTMTAVARAVGTGQTGVWAHGITFRDGSLGGASLWAQETNPASGLAGYSRVEVIDVVP